MIGVNELFQKAYGATAPKELPAVSVRGICVDSRKTEKGDLFIAIRGVKSDGAAFIEDAVRRGASAVVAEGAAPAQLSVPFIAVTDDRDAAARLASAFYDFPSRALKVIGLTGTNGKTTTSFIIEHLLKKRGEVPGVIGTVNYRYAGTVIPAVETTPGPLALQRLFSDMKRAGTRTVVMEVSAHALDQGRVSGVEFETALFTNLTQDHLDYFKGFEDYFEAKAKLFRALAPGKTAVLNADDAWCVKLKESLKCRTLTFGLYSNADIFASDIVYEKNRTLFTLTASGRSVPVTSPLVGTHNVYNALAALAALQASGYDAREMASGLADFAGVPGRLEPVDCGQEFSVFIDYAHTPDGLEKVLSSLKPTAKNRLFVVFGCGGDRDRAKRPKMGVVASRFCDHVYLTSDNPRSEDPQAIIEEIKAGFPEGFNNYTVVIDRKKAIRQAFLLARRDDTVLLAGKGHETSQVIGDRVLPFSEKEEAEKILSGR